MKVGDMSEKDKMARARNMDTHSVCSDVCSVHAVCADRMQSDQEGRGQEDDVA